MARVDDASIADAEPLWRRILRAWVCADQLGGSRPMSIAFRDGRSGEVSVHRGNMTAPQAVLAGHPGDSIASVLAGECRGVGYVVASDPTPSDPSHALLCCPPMSHSEKKKAERKLAEAAHWVVRPSP